MPTYEDVHNILLHGGAACHGCEYRVLEHGLRRCLVLDNRNDPALCPGVKQAFTAAGVTIVEEEVEDDGFVTMRSKGASTLLEVATGRKPTPGSKLDQGKPRVDLLLDGVPLALLAIAKVLTFGAKKYDDHNWLKVQNGRSCYLAAEGRHRLAGDGQDDESGLDHGAHKLCSALFAYELRLRGEKYDD